MTKDSATIENWIAIIQENEHKLSKWEADFIDSISEQFESKGWISDKQEEILERIYSEKTPT